jgi:hypothetical protein
MQAPPRNKYYNFFSRPILQKNNYNFIEKNNIQYIRFPTASR